MNNSNLILRLEGPLQAWGGATRGKDRDTSSAPTKSGVVGLLGSALGIARGGDFSELNRLRMAVRVDKPGRLHMDFQNMSYRVKHLESGHAVHNPSEQDYKSNRATNRIFYKQYLENASFLVVLSGDADVIIRCAEALRQPVYPLFLGRRNCPPALPVLVGVQAGEPSDVLRSTQLPEGSNALTVIRDTYPGERGSLVQDILVDNTNTHRVFAHREVVEEELDISTHDPFAFLDTKEID